MECKKDEDSFDWKEELECTCGFKCDCDKDYDVDCENFKFPHQRICEDDECNDECFFEHSFGTTCVCGTEDENEANICSCPCADCNRVCLVCYGRKSFKHESNLHERHKRKKESKNYVKKQVHWASNLVSILGEKQAEIVDEE